MSHAKPRNKAHANQGFRANYQLQYLIARRVLDAWAYDVGAYVAGVHVLRFKAMDLGAWVQLLGPLTPRSY